MYVVLWGSFTSGSSANGFDRPVSSFVLEGLCWGRFEGFQRGLGLRECRV